MTNASDERATILNAIMSGTSTKIFLRFGDADDADRAVRVMFTGFVDLEEWKQGSARPAAIGNQKEIVRSWSLAEHEAKHQTYARTQLHSHGEAVGTMTSTSTSVGEFSTAGDSAGLMLAPPATLLGPNAPNASTLPMPLSQSTGTSNSRGSSEQSATSSGTSHVAVEMNAEAETHGHGVSRGTSVAEGQSETYVTQYAMLATQMHTVQEQLHRLAGEVINLGHRECFVKIGNNRPVRTRTIDLEPAFKSDYFRRVMLPLFHKKAVEQSPYLFPASEVDAQIAARATSFVAPPKPTPDLTRPDPTPVPTILEPAAFADRFWQNRTPPTEQKPPKPKPKKPRRGRRPVGDLPAGADKFRVIDGDGDKQD